MLTKLINQRKKALYIEKCDIVNKTHDSHLFRLNSFDTVIFKNCYDITPSMFTHHFELPHVKTVYAVDCNKNFVYYWINKIHLKNMNMLYLASHPCEYPVLNHFQYRDTRIYLSNHFSRYQQRWANEGTPVVTVIDHQKIIDLTEKYECVDYVDHIHNQ